MLRIRKEKRVRRLGDIVLLAVSGALITAAASVLLIMAGTEDMIPFALAGAIVYLVLGILGQRLADRGRGLVLIITAAALIAALVVLRKYIWNGFALIANSLYDYAEESQSYVYSRYSVGSRGDDSPTRCMIIFTAWASAAIGYLASIPPARHRRTVMTVIVIAVMLVLAYFGVEPAIIGIAVMLAFLMLTYGNGRLTSALPLLVAVMLIVGAIGLIDPGSFDPVSRANENIRDRIAFRTATVEGLQTPDMEDEGEDIDQENDGGILGFLRGDDESTSIVRVIVFIAVIVLAIAAAVFLVHRRLDRKRRRIREGIGSSDPNVAIGAMFPYAVRWLRSCGIDTGNTTFSELVPGVTECAGYDYAERYMDMMDMWKQAVYSDHLLTDDDRRTMAGFMDDTIRMVKGKINWREKLRIRFKYAL